MPNDKLIMAMPFYTRLWTIGTDKNGDQTLKSKAYGMDSAEKVLSNNKVEATWDSTTGQYYAEFETKDGVNKIWLEEERSLEEKMKAIYENNLAGVAAWKLGFERESVWNMIMKYVN